MNTGTSIKRSESFTLAGDLDHITVADLKEMLDNYPLDATIEVNADRQDHRCVHCGRVDYTFNFAWSE